MVCILYLVTDFIDKGGEKSAITTQRITCEDMYSGVFGRKENKRNEIIIECSYC
jgi:hypothetical protein